MEVKIEYEGRAPEVEPDARHVRRGEGPEDRGRVARGVPARRPGRRLPIGQRIDRRSKTGRGRSDRELAPEGPETLPRFAPEYRVDSVEIGLGDGRVERHRVTRRRCAVTRSKSGTG